MEYLDRSRCFSSLVLALGRHLLWQEQVKEAELAAAAGGYLL